MSPIPLYSDAHMDAAKEIFPHLVTDVDWLHTQWTDAEINKCKELESRGLIGASPAIQPMVTHETLEIAATLPAHISEIPFLMSCLDNLSDGAQFLSVGCGLGIKELALAKAYPRIQFIGLDNAPTIETSKKIADRLGIKNIQFSTADFNALIEHDRYEFIYGGGIMYVMTDDQLTAFFNAMTTKLARGGCLTMVSAANLTPLKRLQHLLLSADFYVKKGYKKTGWQRTVSEIQAQNKTALKRVEVQYIHHRAPARLKNTPIGHIAELSSRFIYPWLAAGAILQFRM